MWICADPWASRKSYTFKEKEMKGDCRTKKDDTQML